MRLALDREAMYASEFPFVEYGLDLQVMAELEKGIKIERLTRSEYDINPSKEEQEKVNKYIYKMRSRKCDRIPLELQGKDNHAYLIQDWVIHRGKGAPRVSRLFQDIARHYGQKDTEHFLNTKTRRRMRHGGIRFASLGKKHSS